MAPKYPNTSLAIFPPLVLLALGLQALQVIQICCSCKSFLIEGNCSLNCEAKQNVFKDKYHLGDRYPCFLCLSSCVFWDVTQQGRDDPTSDAAAPSGTPDVRLYPFLSPGGREGGAPVGSQH